MHEEDVRNVFIKIYLCVYLYRHVWIKTNLLAADSLLPNSIFRRNSEKLETWKYRA